MVNGQIIKQAVKRCVCNLDQLTQPINRLFRINIGGKLLTNFLKELVSYRQWNLMDQGKLLEVVKENTCFLSQTDQEFDANLKTCK